MASEIQQGNEFDHLTVQRRPIRPKLLKLIPDDEQTSKRNKKKIRGVKSKERIQVTGSKEKFVDDPAYTEDVRHLAFPLRRNSGPESGKFRNRSLTTCSDDYFLSHERVKGRKKIWNRSTIDRLETYTGKDKIDLKQMSKTNTRTGRRTKRIEYSSSDDDVPPSKDFRGRSLDRCEVKYHRKTLCFSRDARNSSESDDLKSNHPLKTDNSAYTNLQKRPLKASNPNLIENTPVSQAIRPHKYHTDYDNYFLGQQQQRSTEPTANVKRKELSKFQIGKRFLKGEIGIKSFNYYLLKEGLKGTVIPQFTTTTTTSSSKKNIEKQKFIANTLMTSKSEENIYEEVYFTECKAPHPQRKSLTNLYSNCKICNMQCKNRDCDICRANKHQQQQQQQQLQQQQQQPQPQQPQPTYAHTNKLKTSMGQQPNFDLITNSDGSQSMSSPIGPSVLQFQSYNPNNPGIYKIESTPVAFTSDYNPIIALQCIEQKQQTVQSTMSQHYHSDQYSKQPIYNSAQTLNLNYQTIGHNDVARTKSSSSSDSMRIQKMQPNMTSSTEFYECPKNYPHPQTAQYAGVEPRVMEKGRIQKTDSRASILSDASFRSENSHRPNRGEISDSSIGDSLFSYPAQKRYYGSTESCRFGFECRRCSLDGDKCSFSDNCRYECRNCDCSSSYFSSDFDDTNHYSRKNNKCGQIYGHCEPNSETKASNYAKDFIKHLANVKQTSACTPIYSSACKPSTSSNGNGCDGIKKDIGSNDKNDPITATVEQRTIKSGIKMKHMEEAKDNDNQNLNKRNQLKGKTDDTETNSQHDDDLKLLSLNSDHSIKSSLTESETISSGKPTVSTIKEDTLIQNRRKQNSTMRTEGSSTALSRGATDDSLSSSASASITSRNEHPSVTGSNHRADQSKTQDNIIRQNNVIELSTKTNSTDDPALCKYSSSSVSLKATNNGEPINVKDKIAASSSQQQQKPELTSTTVPPSTASAGEENGPATKAIPTGISVSTPSSSNGSEVVQTTPTRESTKQESPKDTALSEPIPQSQTKQLSVSTRRFNLISLGRDTSSGEYFSCDNIDILDLPLPEIPTKDGKDFRQINSDSSRGYHHSLPISYKHKKRYNDYKIGLKTSDKLLTNQLNIKINDLTSDQENINNMKMHYRNLHEKPTYMFGEKLLRNDNNKSEIFLNKSGWVQVNPRNIDDKRYEFTSRNVTGLTNPYNTNGIVEKRDHLPERSVKQDVYRGRHSSLRGSSKLEEMLGRNEARRLNNINRYQKTSSQSVDQHFISVMLNNRPDYLQVNNFSGRESPPPTTPIISPPPAFQDANTQEQQQHQQHGIPNQSMTKTDDSNKTTGGKGIVFSRSFECDTRKTYDQKETFSKSFDSDLMLSAERNKQNMNRSNTSNFKNLTGISPNYLTKTETEQKHSPSYGRKADYLASRNGTSIYSTPRYDQTPAVKIDERTQRRPQYPRILEPPLQIRDTKKIFRGLDTSTKSQRLNSCDSGARSDLSNDEPDDDDPTEHLRKKSLIKKPIVYMDKIGIDTKTKLKLINRNEYSTNTVKQQNTSGSRNSTLERQLKGDDKTISRSSSSSSYSAGEQESGTLRRTPLRNSTQRNSNDSRIRRSRSLQLTDRSPNRGTQSHRILLRVGGTENNGHTTRIEKNDNKKPEYAAGLNYGYRTKSGETLKVADNVPKSLESDHTNKDQRIYVDYDFDKSRSFDEDYSDRNTKQFMNEYRSFSSDRVFSENSSSKNNNKKSIVTSPSYGKRLLNHNLIYDSGRSKNPSPIMDFCVHRPTGVNETGRDVSPSSRLHNCNLPKTNRTGSNVKYQAYSSDSDCEGNNHHILNFEENPKNGYHKDQYNNRDAYKTDSKYYLDRDRKVTSLDNSSTGSSSDNWPITLSDFRNGYSKPDIAVFANIIHNELGSNDDDTIFYEKSNCAKQRGLNNVNLKINDNNFNNCICANTLNGMNNDKKLTTKPPIGDKHIGIDGIHSMEYRDNKTIISVNRRFSFQEDGNQKPHRYHSDQRESRNGYKMNRRNPEALKNRYLDKVRSRSLPKLSIDANNTVKQRRSTEKLNELFTPNLISQAKASSSPSLTNDLKKAERLEFNILTDEEYQTANDNNPEIRRTVLQKVKRTITNLSNLKNKTGTNGNLEHLSDSQKTGIELLKCRTNKERNKVKQQRKDKCISGDSGIQVDDADGDYVDCVRRIDGTNLVRRTNSTKVNSKTNLSPVKIKSLRKQMLNDNEKIISTPLPIRSLSQPSGLDSITPANGDSDTESVISMNDLAHNIIIGEATDNFKAVGKEELSLERGDKVIVLKQEEGHWWYGHLGDQLNSDQTPHGWFPKDYIKIVHQHPSCELLINSECSSKDIKNCDILNHDKVNQSNEDGEKSLLSTLPIPNSKKIRDNCIAELIKTEITYVNLLSSICVGYIRELKKHPTVFSPQSLQIIFSNIEQIWSFQQKFLAALTAAVERNQIAQTFIEFQSGFFVYSTYCNSYSRALMELETFADNKQSSALFEKCRLAEKLPELPLSAHLLAPIQKICRYPLILNELVKHSDPRIDIITALRKESPETTKIHLDKSDCKEQFEIALTAMKQLTIDVNEGKRHSEHLATVQSRFDNFQGPPLSAHSSRFFIQMDAIRMSPNLWNNTYTLFLFDHQLVYCKKDLLKRSHTYKGRVFLDNCHVLNLPDGKIFGVTLKNALRIYCDTRHKWFDFCFRTSENKEQFLNALSIERQFCGGNFYISELPGEEDIQLSDRESDQQYFNETEFNSCNSVLNERAVDVEEVPKNVKPTVQNAPSPVRLKKADSLPKSNKNYSEDKREFSTNSLGRKRIGKWFRKAKSTNTTPSHSPTHQRHSMIAPGEGNQHGIAAEQIQPPNTTETIIASKIQEEAKAFNS